MLLSAGTSSDKCVCTASEFVAIKHNNLTMRRTAVRSLEGAVSLSRARKPLSRSFATVKDPLQKVSCLASILVALVHLLIPSTRTHPNLIIFQNFQMAFALPLNHCRVLSRLWASTSMQVQDTRMKVYGG